eukprot:TRINITY_DN3706_c0_g1_i4.p1 TRINITY_DN3706_c0_g1~~TRINITY_DN3706_c0_g1_i4.p1  ORF type:complete len:790 (-),score=164.60 TRINITY_DN3706_c0_g1_i4:616-2985(-)
MHVQVHAPVHVHAVTFFVAVGHNLLHISKPPCAYPHVGVFLYCRIQSSVYPSGRVGPGAPAQLNPMTAMIADFPLPQTWQEAMECIEDEDDMEKVVEGSKVICHELERVSAGGAGEEEALTLEEYARDADRLIACLTTQVWRTFHLSMIPGQSSRPCKYVLNTLMQIFQIHAIGHTVGGKRLKPLVAELLLWLLDERVPSATEDGPNLLKALNVLMLKIMDNALLTPALLALIGLLQPIDPQHATNPSPSLSADAFQGQRGERFSELVIRCLIKLTKSLSPRLEEVDLDRLLQGIHEYLQMLGLDEIRRRAGADDKPLRMVKTVLHELCKLVGPDILGHLSLVPLDQHPQPIVVAYIDLNLQTLAASGLLPPPRSPSGGARPGDRGLPAQQQQHFALPSQQQHMRQHSRDGSDAGREAEDDGTRMAEGYSSPSASSGGQISDALRGELRSVFKKLGSNKTSAAGLHQLWTITQLHPDVDVLACLHITSDEMRRFVREGLAHVERTVRANGDNQAAKAAAAAADHEGRSGNNERPTATATHAAFTERRNPQSQQAVLDTSSLSAMTRQLNLGSGGVAGRRPTEGGDSGQQGGPEAGGGRGGELREGGRSFTANAGQSEQRQRMDAEAQRSSGVSHGTQTNPSATRQPVTSAPTANGVRGRTSGTGLSGSGGMAAALNMESLRERMRAIQQMSVGSGIGGGAAASDENSTRVGASLRSRAARDGDSTQPPRTHNEYFPSTLTESGNGNDSSDASGVRVTLTGASMGGLGLLQARQRGGRKVGPDQPANPVL